MTRTLIVLAGLLACTAARAEEPHEKWLKYLVGEWKWEDSLFGVGTSNWSFAPGNHALFGKGSAPGANGQTAEIIGWEPDKKALVHTVYGTTKGSYYRLEYTRVTDKELSGTDTGVMPDGRPYAGKMAVRRVDDRTFTFEFSGNYKDGKKEEYKGTGKAVRVTAKDNAATVKALRDWGDFFVGGVWSTTDGQGKKYEDRWEWVLNKSFLQLTRKVIGEGEEIYLGEPEPGTGRWVFWGFLGQGGMGQGINGIGEDGAFLYQFRGQGKDGPFQAKGRVIRVKADEVQEVVEENILDGKRLPPETLTWTRKK